MAENPQDAISAYCLECTGDNADEVKRCTSTDCSLYRMRLGANYAESTRLDAIRKHCAWCQQSKTAPADCMTFDCELHDFRPGGSYHREAALTGSAK